MLEERKRKREEQKKVELAKKGSKGISVGAPPPPDDGCIVDRLLNEIREGTSLRPMKRASMRKGSAINKDEMKKLKDMAEKSEKAEARRTSLANLKDSLASMNTVKEEEEQPIDKKPSKEPLVVAPLSPVKHNPTPSLEPLTESHTPTINKPAGPTIAPQSPVKQNPTPSWDPVTPTGSHTPTTNNFIEKQTAISVDTPIQGSTTLNPAGSSTVSIPDPVANLPKSKSSSSFLKGTPSTDEDSQATPTSNINSQSKTSIVSNVDQPIESQESNNLPMNNQSKSSITISVSDIDVVIEPHVDHTLIDHTLITSQVTTPSTDTDIQSNSVATPETTPPQLKTSTSGTTLETIQEIHASNGAPQTTPSSGIDSESNSLHPDSMMSSSISPSFDKSNNSGKKTDSLNLPSCTTCGDSSDSDTPQGVDYVKKILNQYRPASGIKMITSVSLLATPIIAEEFKESKLTKKKKNRRSSRKRPGTPEVELISVRPHTLNRI